MSDRTGITEITAPIAAGNEKTPLAVHFSNESQGGLKFFGTTAEMIAFGQSFEVRCFQSVAFVDAGENNYKSLYLWTGTKQDGSGGSWQFVGYAGGVVLADTDGAIPRLNSTIVFSDDFEIQEAGDQGNGSLIQLSDQIKSALAKKSTSGGSIDIGTFNYPDTFGKGNSLEFEWPLKAWPDPNKSSAFRVSMDHASFEPLHKPSFLAYVGYPLEIVGKIYNTINGHHYGTIFFDDVRWPSGPYIQIDKKNKAYGIQEADALDPNVSGGTDYLIAFRAHMAGKTPNDGTVKIYLYNKSVTPISSDGYLNDKNGNPLVVSRHYKKGEQLDALEVAGIVSAKGLQEFTCHIVDDFKDDRLNITDPYYGETGLLIQALTSESSTGLGRLQFEQDTGLVIHESKMYLGAGICSIDWVLNQNMPIKEGGAAQGQTMTDGLHFYNVSKMKMGVDDGHLIFSDNGIDICDFSFGKIFNSEETKALRGKSVAVKFTGTITDKNSGFNVALMKWTGTPDDFTPEIFTSRNNGSPIFQKNWLKADDLFISEDVVSGDHKVTKDFTIPTDASNYAVIIYPVQAQLPITLKLKQFDVDVNEHFTAYGMRGLENLNEKHLIYSDQHKEFKQDLQGLASLRYTLGSEWSPVPAGGPSIGNADITLDTSINQVPGSQVKRGEGAYKFAASGSVSGYIDLFVWNEQKTESQVYFKLLVAEFNSNAVDMENGTAISSVSLSIPPDSKGTIVRLHIPSDTPVITTERWFLVGKSDKSDGAFLQCNNNLKPLIKTVLTFKELV